MHFSSLVQRQPGFVDYRLASQRFAFDNSAILAIEAAQKTEQRTTQPTRRPSPKRHFDWAALYRSITGFKPAFA